MVQALVFMTLFATFVFVMYFSVYKNDERKRNIIFKSLGVLLFIVSFYRLLEDNLIAGTIHYNEVEKATSYIREPFYIRSVVVFISLSEALVQAGMLMGIVTPFFSKGKLSRLLGSVASMIGGLVAIGANKYIVYGYVGYFSEKILPLHTMLTIEGSLMIMVSIITIVKMVKNHDKYNERDLAIFLLLYFTVVLMIIPNHSLKAVFGLPTFPYMNYSTGHINILLFSFASIVFLIISLKNKPDWIKQMVIVMMSLSCFYTFYNYYSISRFNSLTALPIHLCHTAVILMPLGIIFKIKPVFYFTYFVNVLGAFFALAFPSIGERSFFNNESIRFWYNHYYDFVIPIVTVGIGYFERPQIKDAFYSLLVFTGYFVLVMVINTIFVTLPLGEGTDYFFLNGDTLANKIGILKGAKANYVWTKEMLDGTVYKLYWLYDLLVYIGFCGLTFVTLFFYEYMYKTSDLFYDMLDRAKEKRRLLEMPANKEN